MNTETEMKNKKYILLLFSLSMFFTGMSGIINEYILAKLSTDILGNSAIQWGLVIGTMLFMMGIGGSLQLLIKDRQLINAFVSIEILLTLLCASGPLTVFWAFGYIGAFFKLILYFYIISIGLLVGAEIPLIIRLSKVYMKEVERIVSLIFSMDYIGSFIGTLLWILFIIKIKLPLYKISFIVAAFNFTAALITFIYLSRKNKKSQSVQVVLFTLTLIVVSISFVNADNWENLIYQRLFSDPIVYKENTPYQSIIMTQNPHTKNHYLFINGNTQLYEGDEKIYHESLVMPSMHMVEGNRVLILGGGDGCALREVLKFPKVKEVTLVDLDPAIIKFAAENPSMRKINGDSFNDPRVTLRDPLFVNRNNEKKDIYLDSSYDFKTKSIKREKLATVDVYNIDAKNFLENTQGFYDLVIIDFPDPNNIELTKLYSLEFFLKLKSRLSRKGVFVIQSTSPTYAKEAYWCIKRTIDAAGFHTVPYHVDVPSFGDWGFIMGSKENLTKGYLIHKFEDMDSFQVETKEINPSTFLASLNFRKGLTSTKESNKDLINTLSNPVLLELYLIESWTEY